jgi:2-iminobutanoate/2-iminopropanoate deaminase
MRSHVFTEKGAAPKGPYSQVIIADGLQVYVSGQGPVDPETGELVLGSFREQAIRTFENLGVLLEAAGACWEDVVKVNAYLADMDDFREFNEVYTQYLSTPYPARTTVQSDLNQIAIEVDCIAVVPQSR